MADRRTAAGRAAGKRTADQAGIERRGLRRMRQIGRDALVYVTRRFRAGGSSTPRIVADAWSRAAGPVTLDAMVLAHLTGLYQGQRESLQVLEASARLATIYDAAIEHMRRRLAIPRRRLGRLRTMYKGVTRDFVERTAVRMERKLDQAILESVRQGYHVTRGIAHIRRAMGAAGVIPGKMYAAEAILRTGTAMAYSAGQWEADDDPAVREILWGYEYVTAADSRVRTNHALIDGMRRPRTDQVWRRWWPPNGVNCRCQVIRLFESHRLRGPKRPKEVKGKMWRAGPDRGWAFNPALELRRA